MKDKGHIVKYKDFTNNGILMQLWNREIITQDAINSLKNLT
jgi:hypothetical protein